MSSRYTPRIAKPEPIRVEKDMTKESSVSPVLGGVMVLSWVALGFFFYMVHPESVQNVLVPQGYLPAVGLVALSSYFTFAYLGKASYRGVIASVTLGFVFWLMLRNIMNIGVMLYVFAPWVFLELILTITKEK